MARNDLKTRVRRGLRVGSRAMGQATAGARMTPDFLIVGAQRCGTTSMFKALSQHPAVLPAVWHKGVHFFDKHYDQGFDWYRGHFPLQVHARKVLRQTGVPAQTGESSPYYMFHPLAPTRIAHALPDVRLIALVRDPVERTFSAYTHERARGYESESFERALELEAERLDGEVARMVADPSYDSFHLQHNAYVTRGQYVEQLERLAAEVGRDRVHVVDSHDFFADPQPTFARVLEFLGLPPAPEIEFEQHNARPRSPMDDALRARLEAHFEPYDERLTEWLGRTPRWRS